MRAQGGGGGEHRWGDGDRRETRAVEVSTAGPAEPSRVIGASRATGSHTVVGTWWAHGTRGAIRRVADDVR